MSNTDGIQVFQHINFAGSSQLIAPTKDDKKTVLGQGLKGEVSSLIVTGDGVWNLIDRNGTTVGMAHSKGGPKGDGRYPDYGGYFPNDVITDVQSMKPLDKLTPPPAKSAEELAWFLSNKLAYSKGKVYLAKDAPDLAANTKREAVMAEMMGQWGVMQHLYYQLYQLFPPSGDQWFSLMSPGQPLNQKDYLWTAGGYSKKPQHVEQAEFELANQVYEIAPIILAPKAYSLVDAWNSVLNSIVVKPLVDSPLLPMQNTAQVILQAPQRPTSGTTSNLDVYSTTTDQYLETRKDWQTRLADLLSTNKKDNNQIESDREKVAITSPVEQFGVQKDWQKAVLAGRYHEVQDMFSFCDMSGMAIAIARLKERMRNGEKMSLDQTESYYPVKFSPSDWAESLSTDFTPTDLTRDPEALQMKLTSTRREIQRLTEKRIKMLSIQGDTDIKAARDAYEAAKTSAEKAQQTLLSAYMGNIATAVKLYIKYQTGAFMLPENKEEKVDAFEKAAGVTASKRKSNMNVDAISSAIDDVVAGNDKMNDAQSKLNTAARDVVAAGVRLGLAEVSDRRADLEEIENSLNQLNEDAKQLQAAIDEVRTTPVMTAEEKAAAKTARAAEIDAEYDALSADEKTKITKDDYKKKALEAEANDASKQSVLPSNESVGPWMDVHIKTKVSLKSQNSESSASSSFSSWHVGLFFGSGGGSSSSNDASSSQDDQSGMVEVEIGLRCTKVGISRPGWFDMSVLRNSKDISLVGSPWAPPVTNKLQLLDRDNVDDANNCVLPSYPVAMLLTKDVTIRLANQASRFNDFRKYHEASSQSGGGAFIFSYQKSSSEKSQLQSTTLTQSENDILIRIPGAQISGFIFERSPTCDSAKLDISTATAWGKKLEDNEKEVAKRWMFQIQAAQQKMLMSSTSASTSQALAIRTQPSMVEIAQ